MNVILRTILILTLALAVLGAAAAPGVAGSGRAAAITSDQRDRLKSLAIDMRTKTSRIRDDLMRARTDLFRVYQDYNLDERKAKTAIEKIGRLQRALLDTHLDNQVAVRRVLTEDQFAEFWSKLDRRIGGREGAFMPPPGDILLERFPEKVIAETGLSTDQQQRLRKLGGWQRRKAIVDKIRRDSEQLVDVYSEYNLDNTAARKLIDSLHTSQTKLSLLGHGTQQALRSVLTEHQFTRVCEELSKRAKHRETDRRPNRRF